MGDWSLPDRGVFKGEALQNFANRRRAIQEGEQAALATVPLIRQKIAAKSGIVAR